LWYRVGEGDHDVARLIRNRLAMQNQAGALEDHVRYLRVIQSTREANPSPAIRSLVGPLLR
jgi:hypothetical protein